MALTGGSGRDGEAGADGDDGAPDWNPLAVRGSGRNTGSEVDGPGTGLDPVRSGLAVFGVVVVVGFVAATSFSTVAFGTYNPAWDGTSSLERLAGGTGTEQTVALRATRYGAMEPNGTVAFVLAPESRYDRAAAAEVADFVRRGGTLVVASKPGSGVGPANDLLAGVGAGARIDDRPLRDGFRNHRGPAMPVAPNVTDNRLVRGVDALTLNHGTVVRPGKATVLIATSRNAYLDVDGDGTFDGPTNAVERPRSYPVVTVESVGEGRVLVVSDPSVFVNAMLERPGNERFARAVLGAHDRLVVDYSHRASPPPARVGLAVLRNSNVALLVVGFAGVAAVGALARRRTDD